MVSVEKYDAIVIGGGPAGSTFATLLAMRNRKVLLLEKEKFPRYHIGESLVTGVIPILEEIDVFDKVQAHGFLKKYGVTLVWGKHPEPWNFTFSESGPAGRKYGHTYQVVRSEFDNLLLRNAEIKGVDVREEHQVVDVLLESGRCIGIKYRNSQGEEQKVYSSYTIDASGQGAYLGNYFNLLEYDSELKNIATWAYFKDVEQYEGQLAGNILTEHIPDGWIWVIPLHNGLTSIGWVTPSEKYKQLLDSSIDSTYMRVLNSSVETRRRLHKAERYSKKVYTTRDWSYQCKKFYGSGFLLTGDAAGFVDPLFSTGIFLALNSASLGAKLLNEALEHPEKEETYLARYELAYRKFFSAISSFVHYFYDASRDQESYFRKAQELVDENLTPREEFVYLISGLHGFNTIREELRYLISGLHGFNTITNLDPGDLHEQDLAESKYDSAIL